MFFFPSPYSFNNNNNKQKVSRRNKTQGEGSHLISTRVSPFFPLMSLIDNQTEAVIPQDATLPIPSLFVIVSWQSEPPARPGWQLAVLTAALPENGTLPVELQLPPLLLPLLSIACRCWINIPCQGGTAITARFMPCFGGTSISQVAQLKREMQQHRGCSQALKSEKRAFSPFFFFLLFVVFLIFFF